MGIAMMPKKMKTAGYSGTPLAKKLGIKDNSKIKVINQPLYYFKLLTDLPSSVNVLTDTKTKKAIIHYFAVSISQLSKDVKQLKAEMESNGAIWISWPKKTSTVRTDLNENIIRDIALKNNLVDVKVCAIDEVWSGLKLVIRLKDRK
jgi:hypothetical protein